jgi:hypothetical protein
MALALRPPGGATRDPGRGHAVKGRTMDENEHPRGALVFMLIYLITLAVLWFNAYMRLWG